RYDNFVKAVHPCDTFKGEGFPFDDTDVYKTIEGASYLLQTYPDPKMEAYIDSVLTLVAAAQEPDGYLNTSYTMNPAHPHAWMSPVKWEKVEELSHEFYNLGHMVEGAVAHYQATGKRNFLDIAMRYADCVCREIGDGEGQLPRVPGHQIAEMALARLYLATGDRKYLDQAKYFLDKRGHTSRTDAYSQAHRPVVDQDEAVGHAVRAGYMYSGMADVAALTGDSAYIRAIDRIWDNIVGKKLYITGGVGATRHGEAFGANYELPNLTAYCETCAAIGNVYTNHRLFLLHGQSKYYDVLERTLYNGLISGVSLDGGSFFYPNPLESNGEHRREPWFGCACCPSNISRFIPSLPGYVYAVGDNVLYVNLFMGSDATLALPGGEVKLSQTTDYPRDGKVALKVDGSEAGEFALKLRIPGWVKGEPVPSDLYTFVDKVDTPFSVTLNGSPAQGSLTPDGYYTILRRWKAGDRLELNLPMEPRLVKAHDKVEADRGRLAVQRGPLVYCAEWADNSAPIHSIVLPESPRFTLAGAPRIPADGKVPDAAFADILTLTCPALSYERPSDGTLTPAAESAFTPSETTLTLIPYYAWAHRGQGAMA
ncbi:MAG: glycoside hydrolase family 127 protein, partial [Duncaniella sp.]|nr:glycoside hydrolase family 127 protein [Duncaniella sp.]